MLDTKGTRGISQVLNSSTWGSGGDGQRSCRGTLQGEQLTLRFSTVFYFGTNESMRDQQRRLSQEAEDCMKNKVNEIKKSYSDACDKTLTSKVVKDRDDVELISAHANTPRRVAYYHRWMVFELS